MVERGEAPAATYTYAELCCHTLKDFDIMNIREKISFKVNEEDKIYKKEFLDFKNDINRSIANLDFFNDDEALDKKNQLEAMSIACDAIMILGQRYSEYAAKLAEEEKDPPILSM